MLCALHETSGAEQRRLRAALRALPADEVTAAALPHPELFAWTEAWLSTPAQNDQPRRAPRLPSGWNLSTLRAIRLKDGGTLPREAVTNLLGILQLSPPLHPLPALSQIAAACTPASLDGFAWSLVECWEAAGAKASHDWALWAVMHIGGPRCVRGLAARASRWPQQGATERALRIPTALWGIASPMATMVLHHLSLLSPSPRLREAAADLLGHMAAEGGLPVSRLLAEQVPWLGFSASRDRTLVVSGRRLVLTTTDDDAGDLVLETDDDDAGRLDLSRSAAVETLRSDLLVLSRTWQAQLVGMMCEGARWQPATFAALAAHPLCALLLRRVAWCAYDAGGHILGRVYPDRPLPEPDRAGVQIGIPHPTALDEACRERWARSIPQPLFPQLLRPVYTITEREASAAALDRYQGAEVEAGWLFARQRWGWSWGPVGRGGVLKGTSFPVPGARGVTAHIQLLPGIKRGKRQTQRLGRITLKRDGAPILLGEAGPVAFSELIYAVEGLVSGRC